MSSCFIRRSSSPALSLLTAALLLAGVPVMTASAAEPAPRSHGNYTFSIEQQPLVSALNAFTTVTGWQVGLPAELGQGVSSPGVRGALPPDKALDRLLVGTSLSYRKLGSNTIVLEKRTAGSTLNLQQVTISATRNAQDVDSVPSTVSVQEREALDRQNVNTIRELVRYEPNVSVGGAGGRSSNSGYNIRGIDGDRILTQVDGVEVPDNFFNGPYAKTRRNYVDPEIVKRVEILRGPASALYGSSAIGGAVSYFTLDPDDIIKPGQDVGARLKTGYSSADESWLTSGTVAGRVQDFDGLLHLSQRNGHEMESYDGNNATGLARTGANPEEARTTNVLAKLGWKYGDDNRLGLTYEKYKDDRDVNLKSAVGGPFNAGPFVSNWYRARTGNDTLTRERFGLENSFALESPIADRIKTSLNYQIAKTDQTTAEIYQPSRRVLRTRETLYQERQWVFDAQLDKAFSLGDTDHQVTYGTTLKQQKVTGSREGAATCLAVGSGCTAIGAPSPSAGDSVRKASDFPDPTINTYSLFAQDQIAWGKWTFLPAVRYDYTQLKPKLTEEFLNTVDPTRIYAHSDKEKTWHRVTPKFGLTYALTDHYTWFGQYAEGFRTPSAKALYGRFENLQQGYTVEPNPDLKPESSKGVETGIRGNFDSGSFDIAVFYNKYRNFIDEDASVAGDTSQQFEANNIRHATIKGIEAKGRLNLDAFGAPQGLYSQGSIGYTYGRNDDNGEALNSVNPLKGVFGLGYDQDNYGGLLSWTLVKKQNRVDSTTFHAPDGSATGPFKTPGFGVLHLTAFYKVTNDVTVNGGLYNLTDKKYWNWDDVRSYDGVGEAGVTSPANLDRLTQPGRNFAINVIWDI
ncbi:MULTISPECIES: TonB-dependent receptor [Pseudomonas]|uniref:TonB-dependent hemoglobin/transferrin/lactoferrin family receptor n=1 Tax=Pseudomonas azadiae TaxID=2843612 RepID=A0ABS6NX92_9PSED|nr:MULTISPECIES: TonB-dependent receptor [Pseudomonas]MBV4452411.1 TonB-dependent hemoglobin/transferrin/lactoferrin family receptor [Pseudomonas azadiae]NMF43078.1 TonB-dependent hemoglobin/transferrin/lactoferrin family receptor [Pseudomonas sp. SWRI 103]